MDVFLIVLLQAGDFQEKVFQISPETVLGLFCLTLVIAIVILSATVKFLYNKLEEKNVFIAEKMIVAIEEFRKSIEILYRTDK